MKLFVVSDIHGYADILLKALAEAGYDPENENHLLICCGDLFDRGTENFEVLKFFERNKRKIMIKGNHEVRLTEIINTGKLGRHDAFNGTINTILEFFGKYSIVNMADSVDFSGKTGTVDRICDLIGEMRDYYETERYIFVHGWLPNENGTILKNWRNSTEEQWNAARWTRWVQGRKMEGYEEGKTIVCGHFPTDDGEIFRGECFIAIDAGTYSTSKINVLVLEDELIDTEIN